LAGVGGRRHAHPPIPIIIVGAMKVMDDFFTRGYWSRLRGLKIFSRSKMLIPGTAMALSLRRSSHEFQATRAITFMLSPSTTNRCNSFAFDGSRF
jgi:hypothetical protein